MTRTMYDSTNMAAIPATAEIVAGYPHAFPTDYGRFPKALQVRIDNNGAHADDCHVADVESGAITPATCRQWVESWHLLHPKGLAAVNGQFDLPTVYVQDSNLLSLDQELAGLVYYVWVAWWGVGPRVISGTSLHQYANSALSGGDYDLSVVYDARWGVATVPVPSWQATALMQAEALVKILQAHQ
jgi:hypothetical protein